ncbi:MAG TPA: transglycosylase SLT domain-containing protein, partial [Polyangiaceae bacterium]|nr:transglycosylase SLT domain-containing protein [Polyangiaceae bacterium]
MRRLKSAARFAASVLLAVAGVAWVAPAAAQDDGAKDADTKSKSKKSAGDAASEEKSAANDKKSSTKKRDERPSAKKEQAEDDEAPDEAERRARPEDDLPTLEEAPVGPRQGSGQRKIQQDDAKPAESKAAQSSAAADANESKSAPKRSHQRGPVPRRPEPVLPAGAPLPVPDAVARREIAGGPTRDELKQGTDDPELRALREAERVLFPKPLEGVESGWSWELPQPVSKEGERIVASGLPPDTRVQTHEPPAPSAAESAWLKTLAMPNLPVRLDAHVVKYLLFYRDNPRGKAIARVWAKKSGRYVPAMKAEFAKAGLPTDLVWISLIESGHSPTIYSPAGAAGIWQFMPDAGRLYGLTVDRWVDERLDPQRSTEAAIRYLGDLQRRFGNWELAMAAYNMGYGGLSRAIRKFNTNDFWQLARYEAGVPWETTLYVPKILATAILMNNKQAFGISDVAPDANVRFDTVRVEPGLPLLEVAQAAGVSAQNIETLNPQYRISRTPPARPGQPVQSWLVRVPLGKGVVVSQRLAKTAGDETLEPYVVRFGDTSATIAARFRITEEKLRLLNRIGREEMLSPGTVLLAPQLAAGAPPGSAAGDEVVVVPPRRFDYADRRRIFYRVLPGDTLARVAQALDVTRAELLSWNALDTSARLQAGMVLQAFVSRDKPLDDVRHLQEAQTRVLVAGSDAFFEYMEAVNGRKRIALVVKDGDTL